MNVNLTFLSFSGSAVEFASVESFFEAQAAAGRKIIIATDRTNAADEHDENTEQEVDDSDTEAPSEKAFISLIQRVPLSDEYSSYIRAIYTAGDDGATITDIANETGQPEKRVKSAFRNFGKRTARTPEWPGRTSFFDQKWQSTQNRYWLHPAMRRAIDDGRIAL